MFLIFDNLLPNFSFVNPEAFFLLFLLPIAVWHWRKKNEVDLTLSSTETLQQSTSWRVRLMPLLPVLRLLTFLLLVVALARPQSMLKEERIDAEGIDILIALDLSSSMLSKDFDPDRLESSKKIAADFVGGRPYDRIGVAAFAGEAFLKCPLTTDHEMVKAFLGELTCGKLEDGTAIGMGLATAAKALSKSEAKSKVIILLTDGENNAGYIQPRIAAEIAEAFKIKVYTIGVGSVTEALTPTGRRGDGSYVFGYRPVQIDEALLQDIASMTEGKYFRATDDNSLKRIYQEIDQLEKTKMEVTVVKRKSEEFFNFICFALICLGLEILLRYTLLRTLP